MIGILPAAGLATRMGGLPKFLLPLTSSDDTLLGRHIEGMLQRAGVEMVVIITRPENGPLLRPYLSDRVVVALAETETMSQTVHAGATWFPDRNYLIGMPDTYFLGGDPYPSLVGSHTSDYAMTLGVWRIREDQRGKLGQVLVSDTGFVVDAEDKQSNCHFPHSWGVMLMESEALPLLSPDSPHVGYAIPQVLNAGQNVFAVEQSGEYLDCGTPSEFRRLMASLSTADSEI